MREPELLFYTTEGCHLCEQAEQMLLRLLPASAIRYRDIIEEQALVTHYGERIPLLKRAEAELAWPFSLLDLQAFLLKE